MNINQFYQQQSPLLPRRATEPVTLAPTASMIDPNLETHRIAHTQLTPTYARLHMQHNAAAIHNQNNGYPNSIHTTANSNPSARNLPAKEVTDSSIDDAYVQFIMYCNPSVPLDVDTAELRKGFRNPPKSDGKSFSPFRLYELISMLEGNEIKTWNQLVIDLGVDLPDVTKNQSSQKVQQYAVRLKRWLKVFHVDAFFQYLNNKPNEYISEKPRPHDSLAGTVRDTIPVEEDLAIRALLPEWRPKRGRRKADELEAEAEAEAVNKKQQVRANSAEFSSMFEEYPAAPNNAMTWSAQPIQADPWAAAQVALAPKTPSTGQTPTSNQLSAQTGNQQMRWRFNNIETPSSPYPQSAITPRHPFTTSPPFEEPKSAHPSTTSKSPSRTRKRHGPVVSSAWPSTSNTASGKLRGRPPSNRSVQDGPFSTFPANPNSKDTPTISIGTSTPGSSSPSREMTPQTQPSVTFNSAPTHGDQAVLPKRSKLQLQVPEHLGGPVRLATPPRVLINGESNRQQATTTHERRSSADFFTQLDDVSEEEIAVEDGDDEEPNVDWKKRALTLKRKLMEKEEELRLMKRRVLDAVM